MSFSSACFIHDTEAKVNNLLLKAAANDLLQRWSVSKRVNSWRAARRRDANSTTELAAEADVRFRGQSGRRSEIPECLLLTQSGHGNAFAVTPNRVAMCLKPLVPAIVQGHDARFEPCRGHELQGQ